MEEFIGQQKVKYDLLFSSFVKVKMTSCLASKYL